MVRSLIYIYNVKKHQCLSCLNQLVCSILIIYPRLNTPTTLKRYCMLFSKPLQVNNGFKCLTGTGNPIQTSLTAKLNIGYKATMQMPVAAGPEARGVRTGVAVIASAWP